MAIVTKPLPLPVWAESGEKVQPSNAEIAEGWPLSASFGVAEGKASLETCLLAADQALYEAKHDGRNCVRVKMPEA